MARENRRVSKSRVEPPALPFDVLHAVLAFLPQPDLRKAAAASRTFRQAAKQAGLYIHRTIKWDPAVDVSPDVDILLAVVEHAKMDDSRISLELSCLVIVAWTTEERDELHSLISDRFETLVECITLALDYLVFLRVSVPDYLRTELDAVLLDPAPHLRTFEIRDCGGQGSLRREPLIRLPTDLFAGDAPKLRSVSLEYVPLGPTRIAAFSRVEHFGMKYQDTFPDTDVVHHFPRLSSLRIAYRRESNTPPPTCILRGLVLSKLIVAVREDGECLLPVIAEQLDLSLIPTVECHSSSSEQEMIWTAPLYADEDSELSAHISPLNGSDDDVEIAVTSHDTDWLCTYIIRGWDLQTPYAFFGEELDLFSLRIDNIYLPGLLESGIALLRLCEFSIDLRCRGEHASMIWPLAWGVALSPDDGGNPQGGYSVPCPELETLEIVALEKPMRVRETEVVHLSEALGQLDRVGGARARLVLRGVSFVNVGLDEMFSTVRSVPFRTA